MQQNDNTSEPLKKYHVWDRTVRVFHWVNVLCVIGLIAVGTFILNSKAFGITNDGKILLKSIHVYIGYVLVLNLSWRLVWGFLGNRYARWRSILPFTKQHRASLKVFLDGEKKNDPAFFLGHNPVGRLMVSFLLLLLTAQALTGLVLAGTDIYFPPFGEKIIEWIAEDKSKLDEIKPYSKVNVDPESYQQMRDLRKPIATIHLYIFYTLLAAISLHIIGVIIAESRERSGLISAMFSGEKISSKKPVDENEQHKS